MKLRSELVDAFEIHTGKVICALGFLTCSKSRTIALDLASSPGYRADLSSVLFKIDCESSTKLAEISIENGPPFVVFDVGMTFRIVCINRGTISIIKLKTESIKGKEIAQEYRNNHMGEKIQVLLDQLLATPVSNSPKPTDSKPKLSDHELKAENHLKKGEIDLAITTYEQIRPVSASILVQIGQIYSDKKADYGNALNYYRRALKIQEETGENTADTLTLIGTVYNERCEYDLALQYHTRALKLRESNLPSNTAAISTNLIGISNAYRALNKLSEALDYAQRACTLRQTMIPVNEVSVAASLATIANIYHDQGEASQALDVGMKALSIFKTVLSTDSPELAALFNNLGVIQLSLGSITEARQYFEQSLQIYRQNFPSGHPNLAKLETNFEYVTQIEKQKKN